MATQRAQLRVAKIPSGAMGDTKGGVDSTRCCSLSPQPSLKSIQGCTTLCSGPDLEAEDCPVSLDAVRFVSSMTPCKQKMICICLVMSFPWPPLVTGHADSPELAF